MGVQYRGSLPQVSEVMGNYLDLDPGNKENSTTDFYFLLHKIGSKYTKYKCQIYKKKRRKYRTPGKKSFQ